MYRSADVENLRNPGAAIRGRVHLLPTVPGDRTIERAMQLIKGGFSYRLRKELDQFHSCCNADIALSHPSCARMGHPNLTLSVKIL